MTRSADYEKGHLLAGGGADSDSDSDGNEYLAIDMDESSPLLMDLDPPGTNTTRASYMGDDWGGGGKGRKKSLPRFGIRKKDEERLPWVIVITAVGMAAMVLVGFITMFQEDTAAVTYFTNTVESVGNGNVAGVLSGPSPADRVPTHELNPPDKNGDENLIVSPNSVI